MYIDDAVPDGESGDAITEGLHLCNIFMAEDCAPEVEIALLLIHLIPSPAIELFDVGAADGTVEHFKEDCVGGWFGYGQFFDLNHTFVFD
jgi:hypothetical protein